MRKALLLLVPLLALGTLAAGCGGDDDDAASTSTSAAPTTSTAPATSAPSGADSGADTTATTSAGAAAFCEASNEFATAQQGGRSADTPAEVEATLRAMVVGADDLAATAPTA